MGNSCFECKYYDENFNQCGQPLSCRRGELWVGKVDKENNMRTDTHRMLCLELHKLYKAKDADYGSSFGKTRAKYDIAILIRLNDKLNRLEQLMGGNDINVRTETIDDTLMDMAGYCLLELVERGQR